MTHMKLYRLSCSLFSVCLVALVPSWLQAENSLSVGRGTADSGSVASVPLTLSTDDDAQGFIMAFEWDGSRGTGTELEVRDGDGEALSGAELVVTRVESSFMVLSVVMDLDGAGGEMIAAAQDVEVGAALIRCEGPSEGTRETPIQLVDDKISTVEGGPTLKNTLVQGGLSITAEESLGLNNGALICEGEDGPGPSARAFFACGNGLDDDGNPEPVAGTKGSTQTLIFYYRSTEELQGLSMAVRHSCNLELVDGSLSIEDGALSASEAEFVNIAVDDTSDDGDICELIVGILVDAVPPFDGRSLPETDTFTKLFSQDFVIAGGDCDECLFAGFVGTGEVEGGRPVRNLVSIDFQSEPAETTNCRVCLEGREEFQRGDCNFSGGRARAVDIADAAAQVGFIFLDGDAKFDAPCEDACDANDDGRLDAADVVFLLEFLFVPNSSEPPSPGPDRPGDDPTDDDLTCEGGLVCD